MYLRTDFGRGYNKAMEEVHEAITSDELRGVATEMKLLADARVSDDDWHKEMAAKLRKLAAAFDKGRENE